jgi:hypothetical protein
MGVFHMAIKIDKGIPIPDDKYVELDTMEIGDSIFVKTPEEKGQILGAMKTRGIHRKSRKMKGGWRIWSVEKKDEDLVEAE